MDYSSQLQVLYPDLSLKTGILYMTYLIKSGAQPPKRFIFDTTLLTNEKVIQMNLRAVLKTMEQSLGIQLEQLSVKEPNFNKFSFAVLQTGAFLTTKDDQISNQIVEKMNTVQDTETNDIVPNIAEEKQEDIEKVPQVDIQDAIENKVEVQTQVNSQSYDQWDQNQLIDYIKMLETSNQEFQEQIKTKNSQLSTLEQKLTAMLEVRRRESFVPDLVKKGEGEKRKFLFWL